MIAKQKQSSIAKTKPVQKEIFVDRPAECCPHCESRDFVKRGTRQNKHQSVQLYACRNTICGKVFTARAVKGKHAPFIAVIDAISYRNLGYTFEQIPKILEAKRGVSVRPETISAWYEEYKPLCRFERMLPFAMKLLAAWREDARKRKSDSRVDMVEVVTLAHRQLYRFRYHRPKLVLQLEEYRNRNFGRLMEYLDAVSAETPHQYFAEGGRMSEVRSKFNKAGMLVKGKENFATRLAAFVLPAVPENKRRHEEIQRFMVANDSVTVATEVPVYIRRQDIEHLENQLKFKVLDAEGGLTFKGGKRRDMLSKRRQHRRRDAEFPNILTGHIDIVQVRNGIVHLLDYKPNAAKERPIEQLTWYALALSRLTGLRLFEFKCAWFDEKHYFEFYPLHVVKKLQRKRRRRISYKDGTEGFVPVENKIVVV